MQSSLQRRLGLVASRTSRKRTEEGVAELMVSVYRDFNADLSKDILCSWHVMLCAERRDLDVVGEYRRHKEPMVIVSGPAHDPHFHFEAPPSEQVQTEMDAFIDWFNASGPSREKALPPLVRASIAHLYFETIHPFEDGNGRIGRALVAKSLAQSLQQPILLALSEVLLEQRRHYYDMLQKASSSLQIDEWIRYFGQMVLTSRFRHIEPITDDEVASLVESIAFRVRSLCIKRGYLDNDSNIVLNPTLDPLFQDHESLTAALAASISGKIAFGPNAGSYVRKIGGGFGYEGEVPLAKGKRYYSVNDFSLHANAAVNTHARDRLYKLIEYIARGPLSNDRIEILANGDVKLALKTPCSNGTTHLVFTPSDFIEKLVALIPPPRSHLVRWSGVFAPNSPYRKDITLRPEIKKGFQFGDDADEEKSEFRNYTWSKMLAQVFKIDVTKCDQCDGDLVKVCAITDPLQARRYLKHVGLDYEPPPRAPPRHEQGEFHFESDDWSTEHLS